MIKKVQPVFYISVNCFKFFFQCRVELSKWVSDQLDQKFKTHLSAGYNYSPIQILYRTIIETTIKTMN